MVDRLVESIRAYFDIHEIDSSNFGVYYESISRNFPKAKILGATNAMLNAITFSFLAQYIGVEN